MDTSLGKPVMAEHDLSLREAAVRRSQAELKELKRTLDIRNKTLANSMRSAQAAPADIDGLPWLYLVTPTYARYNQLADLVRMGNTLRQVPNLHWIIVEDAPRKTPIITRFIREIGVRHISRVVQRTPPSMQRKICKWVDPRIGCPKDRLGRLAELWTKPRGVEQRNMGLRVMRSLDPTNGVVYFADDDNSYSLHLFNTLRKVKTVGAWTVSCGSRCLPLCPTAAHA